MVLFYLAFFHRYIPYIYELTPLNIPKSSSTNNHNKDNYIASLIKKESILYDEHTSDITLALESSEDISLLSVADYYTYSSKIPNTADTLTKIPREIWRYEDIIIYHDTLTQTNNIKFSKFKQTIKII